MKTITTRFHWTWRQTEAVGLMAAVLPTFLAAAGALSLLLFNTMSPLTALAAIGLAVGTGFLSVKRMLAPAIGFLLLTSASLLLAHSIYDASFDGQAYHQEAIIELTEGWNPYSEPPLRDGTGEAPYVWINHYPKGPWLAASALYSAFDSIEAGKAMNGIAAIASLLLAYTALRNWFGHRSSLAAASLGAANPVTIAQMMTYQNDGLLGSLLVSFTALLALYMQGRKHMLVPASMVLLMLVNVKFTAIAYAGMIGILFLLILVVRKQPFLKPIGALIAAGVVGVAILGYQPYLTNLIQHDHLPSACRGAEGRYYPFQHAARLRRSELWRKTAAILVFFIEQRI